MQHASLLGASLLLALATGAAAQSPGQFLPADLGVPPLPEDEIAAPPADAAPAAVPPSTAGQGFLLNGITLRGATALTQAELAPIWADLIGTRVTIETLDQVTAEIGAAYRARGYVLSQAILPQQTVTGGVVEVLVVEGFVDTVGIEGGAPNQRRSATAMFAPLPDEKPMKITTLERGVLLARDTFGGAVETVLEPSPTTFGAADLTVLIEPEPVSYFVTADNRGSRLYGEWTVSAGTRSYNLLGLNERLDTLLALAPNRTSLALANVTLDLPIESLAGTVFDGGRLELRGDFSRADPDLAQAGSPDTLDVTTDETDLRVGMIVPFIRTRSQNLFGRAGVSFRNSVNNTYFEGSRVNTTDRLVILDIEGSWDLADGFGGVNLVTVGFYQGADVAGATNSASGPAAGDLDFTKFTTRLSRLQRIGDSGWDIFGEAIGQYALNVMPNTERFTLGNGTIGRGFAPGNTSGDSGYGARIELRRNMLGESFGGAVSAVQFYAFGDYGRARDKSEDRDGQPWETLASTGIGARIDINDRFTLTPEIARQLEGVATDTTRTGLETRFYIGAIARF